jgi:hypothetical protein
MDEELNIKHIWNPCLNICAEIEKEGMEHIIKCKNLENQKSSY